MNTTLTSTPSQSGRRQGPAHASRTAAVATALAATLVFSGCANVSGLGGSSESVCKAPPGVPCMSVSGVSANERAGTLPNQRQPREGAASAPQPAVASPALRGAGASLAPVGYMPALGALRSDPTVIRIWLAPWQDADGDLVDQAHIYLQIDSGRWLIEHNRAQIQQAFAPRAGIHAGSVSPAAAPAKAALPTMASTASPPPTATAQGMNHGKGAAQ